LLCFSDFLRGPVAGQESAPPAVRTTRSGFLRETPAQHRQLSFGGENAEAYFSADGKKLIFQSTRGGYPCDQIMK